MKFKKQKKLFIASLCTIVAGLLFGVHFLYRSATADDLYYWSLSPEHLATNAYPGTFRILFNKPIAIADEPTSIFFRSVGTGYSDVVVSDSNMYLNQALNPNAFYFVAFNPSSELLIAGGQYRIVIRGENIIDGDSSNYYPASGAYWGTEGFPEFCESCANDWRVTFANPFEGHALFATPALNSTLDFADFATTVRTGYEDLQIFSGNGYPDVELRTCDNLRSFGRLGSDRPSSMFGMEEAHFEIASSTLSTLLGNYDAMASGTDRCVQIHFTPGYVMTSNLGSPAAYVPYTLRYLAHERLAAHNSIVQPDQLFSIDFNQQIELSATTTVARLYDVDAATYVASIPMTTGTNAYVGNGDVSDGMTSDTLYLDFGNAYALEAGKSYRINVPGYAVRKLNSWDYVRYNIDGSEYSFTVANDADAPEVLSHEPSGDSVATTTTQFSLTFDEPVELSSVSATFDIWTTTTATATVSSVSNTYESVSGNEYVVDLEAVLNEAFGSTALAEGETYWIRVSADAVEDDETNSMTAPYIFSFSTVETPVTDPGDGGGEEGGGEGGGGEEGGGEEGGGDGGGENGGGGEEEVVDGGDTASRRPAGRRSSDGSSSSAQSQGQRGITPADSLGQLTNPVEEDLSFGDTGDGVYRLQQALNRIGFYVEEEGVGSPGQETGVFATSTRNALMRFQSNAGIFPAAGFFGPITRALLGFILNW